ncbi:MAG: hypothetical protein RIE23_04005 [Pontimonas sp.]
MIVDPGNPGPDAPLVLVGPSPEHPDRVHPGRVHLSPALRGLQPRETASVAVLRVMVNDATHLEQGVHVVTMRRGMADDRDAMMLLEAPDLSVLSVVAAQAHRENPLETGGRLVRPAMMIARMRHVMMILQLMRTRHRASSIDQRGVN